MLSTDDFNGEDILIDHNVDVAEEVAERMMMEKLKQSIDLLSDADRELIKALYFEGISEREYAQRMGVYHNAIHKRKIRILENLKKILEN